MALPLTAPADGPADTRFIYGFHPDTRGGMSAPGAVQEHAEDHETAAQWLIDAIDEVSRQVMDSCQTVERADELERFWHEFMEQVEQATAAGKDVRLKGPNGWIFYVEDTTP